MLQQRPGTLISIRDCLDVLTAHGFATHDGDSVRVPAVTKLLEELAGHGALRPAESAGSLRYRTVGPIGAATGDQTGADDGGHR